MRALFFIMLLAGALPVWADSLTIFEVRRNIPLSDDEPVYKDYYISGGSKEGLKKDMLVSITREVVLKDPVEGKDAPRINVPVGRLRLIYVEEGIAVARLFEKNNREGLPMLEQIGFMIGDKVEVKTKEVAKAPYKFIEDTARIRPEKEKFAINGEPIARNVASLMENITPKPLLPDNEKTQEPLVATAAPVNQTPQATEKAQELPTVASEDLTKTQESPLPETTIKQ